MAVLLAAAVLVDSKPPPRPTRRPCRDRGSRTTGSVRACVWAISGGAGFLGLHLARRLLADGHAVRTLDLVAARRARARAGGRGASRRRPRRRATRRGSWTAPTCSSTRLRRCRSRPRARRSARSTSTAPRPRSRLRARPACAASSSSPRRRSTACRTMHPIAEDDPLVGVGAYGESKIEAEQVCRDSRGAGSTSSIVRPKTFIGPERLGVFEILFDWIREGRRISILGDGRTATSCSRSRISSTRSSPPPSARRPRGEAINVGAHEFGTVRADLQALIDHAGSQPQLRPVPASRPSSRCARSSSPASRRSPSGTTRRRTATRSWTSRRPSALLGYAPRLSNEEALIRTYDWYLAHREGSARAGTTHRVPWNQQALAPPQAAVMERRRLGRDLRRALPRDVRQPPPAPGPRRRGARSRRAPLGLGAGGESSTLLAALAATRSRSQRRVTASPALDRSAVQLDEASAARRRARH